MEKKVKIGAVAWGLPGGGAYAARTARAAGLDGIQLELGSYEAGYPLAQREIMEGYLERVYANLSDITAKTMTKREDS